VLVVRVELDLGLGQQPSCGGVEFGNLAIAPKLVPGESERRILLLTEGIDRPGPKSVES